MSVSEAAYCILRDAKQSMHAKELFRTINRGWHADQGQNSFDLGRDFFKKG